MKKFNVARLGKKAGTFWSEHFRWLYMIVSFGLFLYVVYLWYATILSAGWTQERKDQFVKSYQGAVTLKKEEFETIFAESEADRKTFSGEYETIRDIFAPLK